jgi:hypothetical protein
MKNLGMRVKRDGLRNFVPNGSCIISGACRTTTALKSASQAINFAGEELPTMCCKTKRLAQAVWAIDF